MVNPAQVRRAAEALRQAQRVLVITGAGLSADSGLPTYRGLGGLYNGLTPEGLPIEQALSRPMLRQNPALCWKYLAELGRACMAAHPNAAHYAIARWQQAREGVWVLTQNIDGYHPLAGSPPERLIEIHGQLSPLFCQSCGAETSELAEHLHKPLPPLCSRCNGILRPPVVLFEERLPEGAIQSLYGELAIGYDAVVTLGTTASFAYIAEPVRQARARGGFTLDINPMPALLEVGVDIWLAASTLEAVPDLVSHILFD
ncbi:NAD-dependent protein deacylase [Pseudomonas typographi]|uniref:protein acetyllysine N-acetyltransferase n=1 Tax=Pseudomonas typographi TaxID=2715964 RepID=A0ABR7Z0I4_9PSED|nr:NAD-dependent protein deacylase [Pseudomonas typographi]